MHPRATITNETAAKVKRDLNTGDEARAIADRYGIPIHTVRNIKCGASWGHVEAAT
jgi:hypothetical protein